MKYVLYYHTGSENHGCEALVRSTSKIIQEKPILYSMGYEEDLKYEIDQIADVHDDKILKLERHSLKYLISAILIKLVKSTILYTYFSRKSLMNGIKTDDICLSIGGDNYCYNGREIMADLNHIMKRKGIKTVLWGCSIDPEVLTSAVIEDLKRYDLITVRESITMQALAYRGVVKNVRTVSDPAFVLPDQKVDLPMGFLEGKTVGINLSPLILQYTEYKAQVLDSFYRLIQEILDTTDNMIALIPHVVKKGNSDLEILKPIYEHFKSSNRVILISDQNCMKLKYIISKCRIMIAARTHASIAAYSSCVPTLVIGYSVKSRGIAIDLFGKEDNYVIPVQMIQKADDLLEVYHWIEYHENEIRNQLNQIMPEYKEKALRAKVYLDELKTKDN
ncbi:polysaccharide pyruvyl transferase family protein [Anaerostipes faecalis]|uniref:polysaccharide pyruvyl transferase family protein n=1 Tax=Anaerostipes faecalis TaxID=2738446 RepID=UPI001C1E519B|nr:polysaccharide pyruvyl transferase family protein [Anaerostipes faecalis]